MIDDKSGEKILNKEEISSQKMVSREDGKTKDCMYRNFDLKTTSSN